MEGKLLFVLFILCIMNCCVCETQKKQCKKVERYDYLQLVLTWGPGYCVSNNHCKRFGEKWTIHGTWPDRKNKAAVPQFCCAAGFNRSAIETIYDELNFWRHEWRKHGSCAAFTKDLSGPVNYFNKTLHLFKGLQLNEVFVNTTPIAKHSNATEYDLQSLMTAFQTRIGAQARFKCRNVEQQSKIPILSEVSICYESETLKAIDCPKRSNCKGTTILHITSQ
ncbi:ribonuclease DdI-like protein [Leptotrombidium deliense]|uniref:Ribonuclease DdI-like protein n=1 Tax=Leptotrombidium deliense TaxID=299467 RepID=A0A443S9R6_9ACAR|nr:ribonuclease DdI-like protein [Leptotrombidium deliense]